MSNIKSNLIDVFPATNRTATGTVDTSRLFTEYNLTRMVNQLTDVDSFIITTELDPNTPIFEFNIAGYYFKVKDYNEVVDAFEDVSVGDYIFAEIRVGLDTHELAGADELIGAEITPSYTGINFAQTASIDSLLLKELDIPNNQLIYRLPLLKYVGDNNWEIERKSLSRLTSESIYMIDGGVD